MTIFAFERARSVGRLLPVCIALLTMTATGHATDCSCRDAIPANSSASGTCTKTQNDSQSCKMDWNAGGGGNRDQNARLLNELQRQGVILPDVGGPGDDPFDRAAFALLSPARQDTVPAMATLIAGALGRNAPDRLPLYRAFLSQYSDARRSLFGPESEGRVSTDHLSVEGRNYNVTITFGCVQFRDGQFLLMLKTQFARTRRDCDER